MTTEEQRCKVCGRLGCYGATEKCYRLGYMRANERAEGLAKELEQARSCIEYDPPVEPLAIIARLKLIVDNHNKQCVDFVGQRNSAWQRAIEIGKAKKAAAARAEGLAKELEALRAQMATTLVFAPPDATHKCAGKCGTFWDCRYNADQKDCPNCGGQLIPAAQASSAATARVAELEATLAHIGPSGGVEQCRKVEARANAAEARVEELEKQLAAKEEENQDLDSRLAKLRAAAKYVIEKHTEPHPDDARVTICNVCDVAAAGVEHEKWCSVGRLLVALGKANLPRDALTKAVQHE